MTVAITIHLFRTAVVYTGHGYFGRFWETATYIISVMVNGHYIHFYKNKYNYIDSYIINTFISSSPCKQLWVNRTTCLPTTLVPITTTFIFRDNNIISILIIFL